MEIKLNEKQRLYVIPCGKGYTCLGFDNCFDETSQLAQLLNAAPPNPAQIGTQGQYDYYQNIIAQFCRRPDLNQETWFDPGTLEPVKERLEHARLHDQKLRLFFGNRETGQCWLEENDVLGFIGRSMGPMRIPILLANRNSSGGGGILTACILRIIDAKAAKELWRQENYHLPELRVQNGGHAEYPYAVAEQNEPIARFKTPRERARWLAFMQGEIMKP